MTEQEWLSCGSLRSLDGDLPGATPRKLYLFILAARRTLIPGEPCSMCGKREADCGEDSATLFHERPSHRSACCEYSYLYSYVWNYWQGNMAAVECWNKVVEVIIAIHDEERVRQWQGADSSNRQAVTRDVKRRQDQRWVEALDLFREIIGNPFGQFAVRREWLSWEDGIVSKLARAIYQERRFEDSPILADALEDAGCTDAALLDHLRSPGPHVRGCWTIDLALDHE